MGLVDRINRAILRHTRVARPADAATIASQLEQVTRLVAVLDPGYVGDTATLLAQLPDGRLLRTSEEDAGWGALLLALDRSGLAAYSSSDWLLRLVAGGSGTSLTLIGRTS